MYTMPLMIFIAIIKQYCNSLQTEGNEFLISFGTILNFWGAVQTVNFHNFYLKGWRLFFTNYLTYYTRIVEYNDIQ